MFSNLLSKLVLNTEVEDLYLSLILDWIVVTAITLLVAYWSAPFIVSIVLYIPV